MDFTLNNVPRGLSHRFPIFMYFSLACVSFMFYIFTLFNTNVHPLCILFWLYVSVGCCSLCMLYHPHDPIFTLLFKFLPIWCMCLLCRPLSNSSVCISTNWSVYVQFTSFCYTNTKTLSLTPVCFKHVTKSGFLYSIKIQCNHKMYNKVIHKFCFLLIVVSQTLATNIWFNTIVIAHQDAGIIPGPQHLNLVTWYI